MQQWRQDDIRCVQRHGEGHTFRRWHDLPARKEDVALYRHGSDVARRNGIDEESLWAQCSSANSS